MNTRVRNRAFSSTLIFYFLLVLVFILTGYHNGVAQCPENIDFEKGDFAGWECDTGSVSYVAGNRNLILRSSPPTIDRHVMQSAIPGDGTDHYGGFPVNCPNGSGHSIRLGNAISGSGAERVSYIFTIPANQNSFSLIYNYAIVFQDPGHLLVQQPRLSIEVMNLTDQVKDTCSSFDFVSDGSLPGFFVSPNSGGNAPVRCKNWSAASINLDGKAGKTIKISFTTTDCLLGEHFGYAYIDVNTDCSSMILGTTYCPADPEVNLKAPPGFQSYRWFNNSNTTLGTQQTITFNPPPHGGDTVYVEFKPFSGYGCADTLTAYLWDTLNVKANAGPDQEFCVNAVIQLGEAPKPGLVYQWTPSAGLSAADISNPLASPLNAAQYTLTATSIGGGCRSTDVVNLVKNCIAIDLFVPTAFTPDGNGLNDRLRPVLYGFRKVNHFRVYNRYGNLLFSMSSDQPGWDGTIKGKPAGTQTVVWMIEAEDAYGRIHKRQGTTVLIR